MLFLEFVLFDRCKAIYQCKTQTHDGYNGRTYLFCLVFFIAEVDLNKQLFQKTLHILTYRFTSVYNPLYYNYS
jgi:hypothetical protein